MSRMPNVPTEGEADSADAHAGGAHADHHDCPDCVEATPYVRAHPKVGRNDPCSCGSGRKFKKCCGA